MKDRPPDVDPHLPSHAVTFEGPSSLEGASSSTISIQVSDVVRVLDAELVTVEKTPPGGPTVIALAGTVRVSARAFGELSVSMPAET